MYYPEQFMDRILSVDPASIIRMYAGKMTTQTGGIRTSGCPFCGASIPSLVVDGGKWFCASCGEGGNVISFVMKMFSLSFDRAVFWLADVSGISVPEEAFAEAKKRSEIRDRIFKTNECAVVFFQNSLKLERRQEAMKYLTDRGLTTGTIQKFRLGYADKGSNSLRSFMLRSGFSDEDLLLAGLCSQGEEGKVFDRFRDRIMFPITDDRKRVLGFGGRVLHDATKKDGKSVAKYLNTSDTPVFDKGSCLYGMPQAKASGKTELIVCEGYMDVIAMHQAGFTNAVAGLGTALTDRNSDSLAAYADRVLLCYDSDEAGRKALETAAEKLSERKIPLAVPSFLPYKDPDECIKAIGPEGFGRMLAAAVPYAVYETNLFLHNASKKNPMQVIESVADRTASAKAVSLATGVPLQEIAREYRRMKLMKMLGET